MTPSFRSWSCEARAANSASMRRVSSLTGFLTGVLAMAQSAQAEIPQKTIVFVTLGIRRCEQLFAYKNGIGAGEKAQADGLAAQGITSGAQPYHRCRHEQARRGNHAGHDKGIHRFSISERGPVDANQHVDGHTLRMRLEIRQLLQQPDSVFIGFAHADNAAGTNGNARAADSLNRAEPVFVATRGDNAAVKLGRSIEVVVICGEARVGQTARLIVGQHSQRAADFELERSHRPHHFQNGVEIAAVSNLPPRSAHAEAAGALVASFFGGSVDFVDGHQGLILDSRFVMGALRAIAAVFGATAGLYREQTTELDAGGIVEFSVNLLRRKNENEKGALIDLAHGVPSPVVAQR